MIIEKCVLLLKSQKSDGTDKYEELLISHGFKVEQVKTLIFNFQNLGVLKEKLENSCEYAGIIFSSPRCVQATSMCIESEGNVINKWKDKWNFTVGEETTREASEKLGLNCIGKESGNAANLSKIIIENKGRYNKPFLFPHGNLKTDTLSTELGKQGLTVKDVLVYDTIPNPNIKSELEQVTNNFVDIPQYVIFFSPSGLASSLDHLREIPDFSDAKLIAIGPVTENAIKDQKLNVFGVTKHPTPQAVLDLILEY